MGWLSDVLIGTQAQAAAANTANMNQQQALLGGVDLASPFAGARQDLMRGREELLRGFREAIAGVGAAGTGAVLDAQARGRESIGAARQNLAQRGMYGSSQMANQTAGINDATSRTVANITGATAGAQGQLAAGRGQALAGMDTRMAMLGPQQAGMQLQQAGMQSNALGQWQHQGQPGMLGTILSGGLGFLGGYFG